jgi:hypothetical protein
MNQTSTNILVKLIAVFSIVFFLPVLSGATQRMVVLEMQTNGW